MLLNPQTLTSAHLTEILRGHNLLQNEVVQAIHWQNQGIALTHRRNCLCSPALGCVGFEMMVLLG